MKLPATQPGSAWLLRTALIYWFPSDAGTSDAAFKQEALLSSHFEGQLYKPARLTCRPTCTCMASLSIILLTKFAYVTTLFSIVTFITFRECLHLAIVNIDFLLQRRKSPDRRWYIPL